MSSARRRTLAWVALLLGSSALGATLPAAAETPAAASPAAASPAPAAAAEAAAPTPAPIPEDAVLAVVDGVELRRADLELAREQLQSVLRQAPFESVAWMLMDKLTDTLLAARAAEQAGLDKDPATAARLAYFRNRVLEQASKNHAADAAETEDGLRAAYDRLVATWPEQPRLDADHILVASEEEARAIIAELAAGADFATLAKDKSIDKGAPGGALGKFVAGQMVEPFWTGALAIAPGSVGKDPVRSRFGWHVIRVNARDVLPPPSYEEALPQLKQQVRQAAAATFGADLRAAAKIEIRNDVLTPPPADAVAGQAAPATPVQ
ncbi:peptidylprolyl isomerase [Zavarzinia sp. CC-PAN008]|uniref:peptidylprolyl isomerase n=1 Tax=Zavarzinia sp. CC-PAN008 TaxID=3243332 RepID=UPI003F749314